MEKENAFFVLGAVIFGITAGILIAMYMHNVNEAMQVLNHA